MRPFHELQLRGQFFLGPEGFAHFDGWRITQITSDLYLATHPEIPVSCAKEGNTTLTLFGHVFDPSQPNTLASDILNVLSFNLSQTGQLEDLPRLTDHFCGRWVIVATSGSEAILLHDAAGQRQVHYAYKNGFTYCASQAAPIAQYLNFHLDPEAIQFRDCVSKDMGYFWLPGDRSMFGDVRRLLPNHSLDLRTGAVVRYYGANGIESRSLDGAVRDASNIMRGCLLALANRFPLAISCSAGFDSRVLVAASQPVRDRVFYFSRRHYYRPLRHPDIAVPRKLLSKNGIRHHIINMPREMSEEFSKVFRANVDTPHEEWGRMAEGLYAGLPEGLLVLMGTVSEVCRCHFGDIDNEITPELIAERVEKRTGLPKTEFSVKAFGEWLSQAHFEQGLIPVLDMLYWEQRAGCWGALWMEEIAISNETISPFNCRKLLIILLSVSKNHRLGPGYELYRKLVEHMWPEGLAEPLNPRMEPASILEKGIEVCKGAVRRILPTSVARSGRRRM